MDDSGTMLYAQGAQPFLQKRAASILMTIKWATLFGIVKQYNLPRSSVRTFFSFVSGDSKLRIEERSSSPLSGKQLDTKNIEMEMMWIECIGCVCIWKLLLSWISKKELLGRVVPGAGR